VVGYHGRKGPKEDPTVMGTAVQYLSVNSATPALIIKDPKTRTEEGFCMAVCCDGSKKSMDALILLCNLRSPSDRINVIICEQGNIDSAKIKQTVSFELEERGCLAQATISILQSYAGKSTKDIIREHIMDSKDLYIDYIFIGNKGADFSGTKEDYLGSVANEILRHTKLNTVFMC
jgi:hypothetical protein